MLTAKQLGQTIEAARTEWGLTRVELARRAGLSTRDAEVAERAGSVDAGVFALLARALGGSLEALLAGEQFWKAPAVAFKSSEQFIDPALVRDGLQRAAAVAAEVRSLRALLQHPDQWVQIGARFGPVGLRGDPVQQAEDLAVALRKDLHLGDVALKSIRSVLNQVGVTSVLCSLGSEEVDGAMLHPRGVRPCVISNAEGRGRKVTALRMTLAHELCHALYDRPSEGDGGRVDVHPQGERASALEQRANAFAAYFLAPRRAVHEFLRGLGLQPRAEPSAAHLLELSRHFGMGVHAMSWHLVNCRRWSPDAVERHKGIVSPQLPSDDDRELRPSSAEELVPVERRGELLDLATLALSQRLVSIGRWRELLGLERSGAWPALLTERGMSAEGRG